MRFSIIPSLPAAGRRSEVRFCIACLLCDESLFDENAKKREIPPFADSVRNDEFEVFQQAVRRLGLQLLKTPDIFKLFSRHSTGTAPAL